MKKVYLLIWIAITGASSLNACPNVTPSFTYLNSHTCGVPGVISITNTSTGSLATSTSTMYLWIQGGKVVDTTYGLTAPSTLLLKSPGLHGIKVIAIDSSGCKDSTSTNANVTSNAPFLKDGNGYNSKAPEWVNCIQYRGDTDSFRVKVTSPDTLYSPTIIWGDGSTNSTTPKLTPGDSLFHYYVGTGIFTYKVVLYNSSTSCTDTLYGTVINQRQPTAGIQGPSSGLNRGCAPHTITFKNSSYNVTKETTITWLFGDGKTGEQNAVTDPDSISHTYLGALCNGIVTLIARNACGQSQTTWNPIDISEKDLAVIDVDTSNCDPKVPFVFHNNSTDLYCNLPDPKVYYWDFGDGDSTGWIASKASQTHVYANPGPYTVMLIAKNNCGSDTTYFSFTAVFTPEPNFILSDSFGCQPVTVTATDISKGWDMTRSWDFGDGNTSTDSSATNTYTKGGDYTLTLSVSNSCASVDTTYSIRVFELPTANFTLRGKGCLPYSQNFTNRSTIFSDSTTYSWDFGDGTSSNDQNPASKTYMNSGNYDVVLKVSNSCGTHSDTTQFEVFGYPKLTITGDSTICTFDSFALSLSADLLSTYDVNWGDGNTSTYNNAGTYKHAYITSGLKKIITTGKGPGGCPTKDTFILNVKPGALAAFDIDKSFACAPASFTITDQSKNSSNYWWYINGTQVSTSSNFNSYSILFDSTIVNIKLKTKNAGFCDADSITKRIFTPNKPVSNFTVSDSANCGVLEPILTNNSVLSVAYNWNLGNTVNSALFEPKPSYIASLSKDTFYNIQLIAYNWAGCADTSSSNITVYPNPNAEFTLSKSADCGPLNINLTNNSYPNDTGSIGIMNFAWNLGDGNSSNLVNQNHIYKSAANKDTSYAIKLVAVSEHGCKDSLTKNVTVYPNPIAAFTPSVVNGCGPLEVTFSNISTPQDTGSIDIMSFNWQINGSSNTTPNPTDVFSASLSQDTTHFVQLIASSEHGCVDTISTAITVYPKPLSEFTMASSTGCSPHAILFNNQSKPFDTGSIGIMSFDWNLGDGSMSNLTNPNNSYISQNNADSVYNIQLIATSEHGCKDTSSSTVTVHPRPKAAYVVDNNSGCGPLTVNFREQSINGDQYYWNFGAGWNQATANEQRTFNPILLFDTVYRVGVTTTSANGCSGDTFIRPIRVLGIPKAEFALSKDTSCNEEVTLFYNTSLAAIKYDWTFGDNTSSKLINPTKTFKADNANGKAITYPIKLTATSVFGCRDTSTKFFTAAPLPKAKVAFDKQNGCGDLNIKFTNASQFGLTQKWSFGEGSSSTIKNPNFTFTNNSPSAKKYVVTLESFASAGCNAIDTATVTVFPKPFVGLQATRANVCDSGKFEFIGNGSNIQFLNWSFGDGSLPEVSAKSSAPYKHHFPLSTYGDTAFTVKVMATSSRGCKDSINKPIKLGPKVIANFNQTPNSACVPAAADFTNKSRNATNYVWEFGDGGGSGDVNPSYIYTQAGTYSVKLTAFDKNGCKSVKYGNNNFEAKETPIAEFVMSPGQLKLPNARATFSNLTVHSSPTTFEWDFGDGSPLSQALNPVHDYVDTGIYKVRLLASNNSCKDVIIKQIIVDPSLPIVDFDPEGAIGCGPLGVQFKEKTIHANKFTWHFGDGSSSNEANPYHVYENDGFYSVTLIAEGPGGTSKIIKTNIIEVKVTPRVYFYATPDSAHLPNARFDMDNKTINASLYSWEVIKSDNQLLVATSATKNPSFIINEVGDYDVTLMATNVEQCHDTLTKPLLLIVLEQGQIYVPTAFTPNRDNINDEFKPVMLGVNETEYMFRIYDRWGGKIFETKNKKAGWNGTVKQENVAESVFVWTISGKYADGTYFNKKGTVTLLR